MASGTAITIADLELFLVEIESVGQEPPVRSLLVRLLSNQGLEGWGETGSIWRPGELPGRRDALLPILAGRSVFEIEDLLSLPALRSAPLRCAVEMASWDLIGRAVQQPLCHLFGGGYRRRVPIAVRLTGASPGEIAYHARELDEQGFHSQIVGSSGSIEKDVEALLAIREVLPGRLGLRFDAAGQFDMETARELCREVESVGLQYLLDPLRTGDLDQVASLRRQTSVPLAVWRAIQSPTDVLAVVRCGAAAGAAIDLQRVGGILASRKCAAIAQAAGLGASLASGPSVGVGIAAMLHAAAASPAYSGCNECAHRHLRDDVLAESLDIYDGMLAVPEGPGLGVEVDREKIERYQVT